MIYGAPLSILMGRGTLNGDTSKTTVMSCKSRNLSGSERYGECSMLRKGGTGRAMYAEVAARDKFTMVFNGVTRTLIHPARIVPDTSYRKLKVIAYITLKSVFLIEFQNENKHATPKVNHTPQQWISGLPKGWKTYGNGVSIVGQGLQNQMGSLTKVRQFYTQSTHFAVQSTGEARVDCNLPKQIERRENIYKEICKTDNLILAYEHLKSNPASITPGETLDGLSLEKVGQISIQLSTEKYQPKPVRRVLIPKANGKTRSLGIPGITDRIVQRAMYVELAKIYDETFSKNSHGYRPGRSCHTALHDISRWNGMHWMIEGDIKGFFDHQILAGLLERRIKDQRFMDLYWKLVRSGYVYLGKDHPTEKGVPQGGIISPILSNIYLHELDEFIEKQIAQRECQAPPTKRIYSKERRKASYQVEKYTALSKQSPTPENFEALRQSKINLRKIPSCKSTSELIYYTRYADDWVIGAKGRRSTAEELVTLIDTFLKEKLKIELNLDKTRITNVRNEQAHFLGFGISRNMRKESRVTTVKRIRQGKTKTKTGNTKLKFYLPFSKILDKLAPEGFMEKYKTRSGIFKPTSVNKFIFLDHASILQRYNSIMRGYYNYYKGANNVNKLHHVAFILRHSCAKTLARKFNLRSRYKVFRKFGFDLTCTPDSGKPDKKLSFWAPEKLECRKPS